ncbi:MAG: mechanosensitive ion channel family protein, partial [Pararhodobacter sp.]|nr:mechanosensitive ion channel family protein [Pararhodobacter sp.]
MTPKIVCRAHDQAAPCLSVFRFRALVGRLLPAAWLVAGLLLALLVTLGPAAAQTAEAEGPDYTAWQALAELAEQTLERRDTPDETLVTLRAEVVAFRAQFLEAQTLNRDRIETLREQIAALGPPPAEGETEVPEIAERRADLADRLARRQAPLLAADEAFRRADGIVRSIDRVLRERQTDALLALWPTPLNPANLLSGANVLISSALTVYGEVYNDWLNPEWRQALLSNLPLLLGALALAALLILRGRGWMEVLTTRLMASASILRGREVAGFLVSLAQLLVPFLGLTALYVAAVLADFTGQTIEALVEELVAAGMVIFVARWLSLLIFPKQPDPGLPLNLDDTPRRRARGVVLSLSVVIAADMMLGALVTPAELGDAAKAALNFPLLVVAALLLFRLGVILAQHRLASAHDDAIDAAAGGEESGGFADRMIVLIAKGLKVLALVAPVLAAVGYVNAAQQLVYPTIDSLGLIALVVILQRLVTAIYGALLGDRESAAEALVPAVAGLLLGLAALPALALIWGARETDLLELWVRFREGFSLGETRIAPGNLLSFILVFVIGFLLTRGLQGALSNSVLPKTTMERGAQKALVSGVGYLGIVIAALVAFSTAGIDLSGLAIIAGALSVGIGFGLQNIVSNFVSGIILLIERPVSAGDWVEAGGTMGTVRRISVRSTVIEPFDRTEVIVPNTDLISASVTNYTKTNKTGRVIIKVGAAYGSDTRKVEKILTEIAEAHPLVSINPAPSVLFMGFGADALEFEIRAILTDVNFIMRTRSDINHAIARRFAEEGVEIPFAQRDIWLRNP